MAAALANTGNKVAVIECYQAHAFKDEDLMPLLRSCAKLETFKLSHTAITGETISSLVEGDETFKNVKELDLSWCKQLTLDGLEALLKLFPKLTSLNIYYTQVKYADFHALLQKMGIERSKFSSGLTLGSYVLEKPSF